MLTVNGISADEQLNTQQTRSELTPEDIPDKMPEDMPEGMPDKVPECLPDKMPEDLPDRMPDRMSKDLPVTKRINVMVGITRSKVILSHLKGWAPESSRR